MPWLRRASEMGVNIPQLLPFLCRDELLDLPVQVGPFFFPVFKCAVVVVVPPLVVHIVEVAENRL